MALEAFAPNVETKGASCAWKQLGTENDNYTQACHASWGTSQPWSNSNGWSGKNQHNYGGETQHERSRFGHKRIEAPPSEGSRDGPGLGGRGGTKTKAAPATGDMKGHTEDKTLTDVKAQQKRATLPT